MTDEVTTAETSPEPGELAKTEVETEEAADRVKIVPVMHGTLGFISGHISFMGCALLI